MFNLGKIRNVTNTPRDDLREAVLQHGPDVGASDAMTKDAHLIEAALETDRRIASLDDTTLGHFSRLSVAFTDIRTIHWTNPTEGDGCLAWIEPGAADHSDRMRRNE